MLISFNFNNKFILIIISYFFIKFNLVIEFIFFIFVLNILLNLLYVLLYIHKFSLVYWFIHKLIFFLFNEWIIMDIWLIRDVFRSHSSNLKYLLKVLLIKTHLIKIVFHYFIIWSLTEFILFFCVILNFFFHFIFVFH